jgi:predicted protein tyrosine phosphatase
MKILFVCSRNKWRSRTAENIFKNNGYHEIRSAGTEPSARIKLNKNDLKWADKILVMEQIHKERIMEMDNNSSTIDKIEVLYIEDKYKYLDKELIALLKEATYDYFSE